MKDDAKVVGLGTRRMGTPEEESVGGRVFEQDLDLNLLSWRCTYTNKGRGEEQARGRSLESGIRSRLETGTRSLSACGGDLTCLHASTAGESRWRREESGAQSGGMPSFEGREMRKGLSES